MNWPIEVPAVPADTYEPHCLMAWAEQVAGADDMASYCDPTRQAAPVELASAAEAA